MLPKMQDSRGYLRNVLGEEILTLRGLVRRVADDPSQQAPREQRTRPADEDVRDVRSGPGNDVAEGVC